MMGTDLPNLFSLAGRTAMITGASGGLGRAMAVALAEHGADVYLVSGHNHDGLQRTAEIVEELGRVAHIELADLSEVDHCRRVIKNAIKRMGHLDILVNNAGIIVRAPAEEMTLDQWESVMRVNARAVFVLTQTAGRHMLERSYGKVINIASLLSSLVASSMMV